MSWRGSERMREFTARATFTPAATEPVPHSAAQARAQIHTPDDNLVTQRQHATARHSTPLLHPLNHSLANHMQINIPLSSGHIHHSLTHTKTRSAMLLNFLCLATLKMHTKCNTFWHPISEKFSFAITPLVINRARK